MEKQKSTIGRATNMVLVSEGDIRVPAKVDTGADSSSIWASELTMNDDGTLSYCLFAKGSEYYTGRRHTVKEYSVSAVRSAHGTVQVRYKVRLSVIIEGRKIRATFTLADRSLNTYPVLIGCRLLTGKFIVDVSKGREASKKKRLRMNEKGSLRAELYADPANFFEKYHLGNERGDV